MNHRIMLLNRWAQRATSVGIFDTLAHIRIHAGGLGNCGIDAGKNIIFSSDSKTVHIYVYVHMFFFFAILEVVFQKIFIFPIPNKKLFLTETLTRHLHSQAGVLAKAPDNPSACRCSPRHDSSQPNCHWDLTCDMLHSHPPSKTRGRSKRRAPACWLPWKTTKRQNPA